MSLVTYAPCPTLGLPTGSTYPPALDRVEQTGLLPWLVGKCRRWAQTSLLLPVLRSSCVLWVEQLRQKDGRRSWSHSLHVFLTCLVLAVVHGMSHAWCSGHPGLPTSSYPRVSSVQRIVLGSLREMLRDGPKARRGQILKSALSAQSSPLPHLCSVWLSPILLSSALRNFFWRLRSPIPCKPQTREPLTQAQFGEPGQGFSTFHMEVEIRGGSK